MNVSRFFYLLYSKGNVPGGTGVCVFKPCSPNLGVPVVNDQFDLIIELQLMLYFVGHKHSSEPGPYAY